MIQIYLKYQFRKYYLVLVQNIYVSIFEKELIDIKKYNIKERSRKSALWDNKQDGI